VNIDDGHELKTLRELDDAPEVLCQRNSSLFPNGPKRWPDVVIVGSIDSDPGARLRERRGSQELPRFHRRKKN
jgi:hypothetical protein